MALTKLKLATLATMDDGRLAVAFDQHLRRCELDDPREGLLFNDASLDNALQRTLDDVDTAAEQENPQ